MTVYRTPEQAPPMPVRKFYKYSNNCPKCKSVKTIELTLDGNHDRSACAGSMYKNSRCKITLGHHLHVWCKLCHWRGAMEDECEELALYETEPENFLNVFFRKKSSFFYFFITSTCFIIFMIIFATLGTVR